MNNSNVKLYIGISFALIILLVLIIVIPFSSKKTTVNNQTSTNNQPTPTTVPSNSGQIQSPPVITATPMPIKATFTGGIVEPLPQPLIDLANQKKNLLQKMPLSLGNFSIIFDYNQDKFIVTLANPKDQSQKSFESWRTNYYPALTDDKFILQ